MRNLRLLLSSAILTAAAIAFSAAPQWWVDRGVAQSVESEGAESAIAENYNAVNIGQLMFIAKQAAAELNAKAYGGAGEEINSMVNAFAPYSAAAPDANYQAANIGQVKYVAKPFYDRLWAIKSANPESVSFPSGMAFLSGGADSSSHKYPWAAAPSNPTEADYAQNYGIANIGQVKNLFSWSISDMCLDSDGDGISDYLEGLYGGDWNNLGSLHFVRLVAVGGNVRTGSTNIPLEAPLKVMAVDERGQAVSNVPLSVTAEGGSVQSAPSFTSANGECSISFIPDFTELSENRVVVSINPCGVSIPVRFRIVAQKVPAEIEALNEVSSRGTDRDPSNTEGSTSDLEIMPPYLGLIESCTIDRTEINRTFLIANPDPLENSGCLLSHTSEDIGNNTNDGFYAIVAGYEVCQDMICPQHGYVMSSWEYIDSWDELNFYGGINIGESQFKDKFSYFVKTIKNGELIDLSVSDSAIMGLGVPKPTPNPDDYIRSYGYAVFHPWIYGYPVSAYGGRPGYTAVLSGSEGADGLEFPLDLACGVSMTRSDVQIEVLRNDLGLENNVTCNLATNASGKIVGIKFYASNKTQDAEAEISFKFSFSVSEGNETLSLNQLNGSNKYYLKIYGKNRPAPYSVSYDESAGPRYRKVSLSGRPISDEKPQSEEENDIEPSKTYIDALSLALRHSVQDLSVSIPNAEFQLCLRRDYKPLVWNFKSGLRPHESPENAFGGNWTTNAVSYVRIDRQNLFNPQKRTSPDTAIAVDENGEAFSFGLVGSAFYPMPSGRSQKQSYLNKLYFAQENTLVLRKKYANTLVYELASGLERSVPMDRIKGNRSGIDYSYYRLKSVTDRFGNKLVYDYPNGNTLIPRKIYLEGDIESCITIEQKNGTISRAWDGEGNCVEYVYGTKSIPENAKLGLPIDALFVPQIALSEVKINNVRMQNYDYGEIRSVLDMLSDLKGGDEFYNLELSLKAITDATDKVYRFSYSGNMGLYNYDKEIGYYMPNSSPQKISGIILPDSSPVSFQSQSEIRPRGSGSAPEGSSVRSTKIIDADGNTVVYTWKGEDFGEVQVEQLQDFADLYNLDYAEDFAESILVYFPKMRIEHFDGSGDNAAKIGEEVFEFNIDAGMALSKTTDFSGNATEYEYADELPASDPRRQLGYAARFSDPTKETRYVNGVAQSKEFAYSDNYRVMESVKDESGRITLWTIDGYGRRTCEKLYASETSTSPERETRFAYDSDFPNFLADTLVLDGAGAGKNMLTRNVPDANGRVAQTIIDPDGLALTDSFEYNKNGRKILHTDPNGNSTAFEYDGFNRLVRVVNPDATERLIEYDLAGRKTKTTSENGVETLYAYNANGLQTSRTIKMSASGADDIATQTSYSPCGKILSTTDPNGNATAFEYDGMGRLMQMTKFEGDSTSQTSYTTSYAYTGNCGSGVFSTDNFKPSSVTDPRGNTSTFAHDALYRETSITLPYSNAGSTTQYSYDAVGNKISETDALNNTTTFEYDAQNNLVKTTFADNSEKSATYSAGGLLLSETDEMGNTTTHEYDPAGRKIKTTFPSVFDGASNANKSPTEEYFYDKNGNLTGRKDANGNLWNFSYDSRNRKIAEIAPALPSGNSYVRPMKFTAYDGVGNPVSLTDANGNTTQNIYDNANRLVQITFPEVQVGQNAGLQHPVETRGYDKNGNLIEVVNPRGIKTQTAYNSFNKPTQITKNATAAASDQIVEAMSYDGNGNLVEITDGNGNKTRYEYDAMNRRTSAVYGYGGSLTRTDTWTYDALNMTNRKGVLLTYDSRNRIHTENSRTYAYDLCGRILSVSDSGNSLANVSYTYDALGRTVSETNGGKTHFYKYDLANNRIKSSYGSINSIFENATFTHTLSYAYDNNNRLISITDQQNRITTYSYDLNGNVVGKAHANGYEIAYTYDALNRLKSQSGTLLDNQYYYDLGGNVVYLVNSQNNSSAVNRWEGTLSYDAFDRLVSEGFYDGESFKYTTYTYDKNSNRTSRVLSCTGGGNPNWYTETINYTVNALNQVSSLTKTRQPMDIYNTPTGTPTISTWAMTYNARGNLAGISDGESMTSYVYDAYDMLVDAFKDIGEGANYEQVRTQSVYDYRGRRIKREVSSIGATPRTKTKEYSYADGVSVLETGLTGTTLTYRGSDQGGGVGGVNYTEYANGDDLNYKIYNLRGDVIKTIGANQATKSFSHYYAFGNHDDVYGSIPNDDFRANTKVEDDDNLLNEGKRFRHIELGIFLTPDPLEYVDGPNPYIYCNQNPWGRWDPEGLLSWRDTGSFAIDILPFAGTGKGGFELITGYDLVTGEPIPRWGSAIGLIGSVVPGGKAVVKGTLKAVVKKSAKESAEKITRSMAKEGGEALTKEGAKAAKETAEQVNEIIISRKKSPEAVRHLEDTDSIGREFTVDRQGAAQRRKQNIADKKKEPKKDRDEAPPAVFKESTKASVRNIPAGDNRSAGAQLGNQLRKIPDGEKVKIKIEE